MATIGKIREKSGLVIILIGLAMAGFVLTDLFKSNSFLRGNSGPSGIGKIAGEEINPNVFRQQYENAIQNQRAQSPEVTITPAMEGQTSNQVWEQLVSARIMETEANKLGLEVTGEEIMDLTIGPNPHMIALQYLVNRETNKLDRQQLYQFITTIQDNPNPEAKKFWADFEKYLSETRLQEKYSSLIRSGMFTTDLEAKEDFMARNKTASIQYVPLFFNAIADSAINISDAELQDYFESHKEDYKREEGRGFEYVSFDLTPTAEDSLEAKKWIEQQRKAFVNAKNDSNFVVRVGRGTFSNKYEPRGSYSAQVEDQIFAADSGTIIGPYYENGAYNLVKVLGSKTDSLYTYKASHILIRPNGATKEDSTEAMNKAREIYNQARAGADFAKLAAEKSQDPSNANNGGDLGWFRSGRMVKKFEDAVAKGNKGDIILVQTEFGAHVIKITENKTNKLVKAAVLTRPVTSGKATEDRAYTAAAKFRSMLNKGDDFDAAAKKMNLTKKIAEKVKSDAYVLPGIESARELVRWAYRDDTKLGDISDPLRLGNQYVVARISRVNTEGYAELETIKDQVKVFARQEKKKDMLVDRFREAMKSNQNNLEGIAKAVQSSVSKAEGINFQQAFVPNLSNEPMLVGYIFGMRPNQVSEPIKGENGVYMAKLLSFDQIKAPENFDNERKILMTRQQQGNVSTEAMQALKKAADVKDYRYLYY